MGSTGRAATGSEGGDGARNGARDGAAAARESLLVWLAGSLWVGQSVNHSVRQSVSCLFLLGQKACGLGPSSLYSQAPTSKALLRMVPEASPWWLRGLEAPKVSVVCVDVRHWQPVLVLVGR